MTKKMFLAMLMAFALVVTVNVQPVLAADGNGGSASSRYEPVTPYDFTHTVFLSGWSSASAVPSSQFVNVVRNNELHQGTLSRTSQPTLDQSGRWGAIFSGIVRSTGIMQSRQTYGNEAITDFEIPNVGYRIGPTILTEWNPAKIQELLNSIGE